MLSNAAQYAIRATLYLAMNTDETQKVRVREIANDLECPQPFLAKLMQQLSNKKLVSSAKGPTGGFYLSKKDRGKTVWDILIAVDGSEKFMRCFMGLSECSDLNPCPAHATFAPFKQKIISEFKDQTIAAFAEKIRLNGAVISLKDFNALED